MSKLLPMDNEWTFEKLEMFDKEISKIAKEDFLLDTYENQIEIITAQQMIEAYSSNGIPINYSHWSFGKKAFQLEQQYKSGKMGLAYEIVINTSPVISYLMEENILPMQALVIAHACYGHNAFFKNNYLFKQRTQASEFLTYMDFAKKYIKKCEIKYGKKEVELFLDSCHSLSDYGIDSSTNNNVDLSIYEEEDKEIEKRSAESDYFWSKVINQNNDNAELKTKNFPEEPVENILYFFEKYSPNLKTWQRELIRITRKISEYYYPQRQTQVSNEGFASFMHFNIMQTMFDKGLVDGGFMLKILASHSSVIIQPEYNSPHFSGINPYALGFAIYQDIKRMSENPTEEDCEYFPNLVNKDFRKNIIYAMENYNDSNFIYQYLSPKVIRDFKLFSVSNQEKNDYLEVTSVSNKKSFEKIRDVLSEQYDINNQTPKIEIINIDIKGDRTLTLRYYKQNNVKLDNSSKEVDLVLSHIKTIWGFKVILESYNVETKNVDEVFHK